VLARCINKQVQRITYYFIFHRHYLNLSMNS